MQRCPDTRRGIGDFTRFLFGQGDVFGKRFDGDLGVDDQHIGCGAQEHQRRKILECVIGQGFSEGRIDGVDVGVDHERIAVGRGLGQLLRANDT